MAYEVTCPSCRAAVSSPFVRVGAAVACASCGQVYRIQEGHVRRRSAAAAAPVATEGGSSLQIPEPTTEELLRRAADGHIVGLSGLSEMMRQETTQQEGAARNGAAMAPPPQAVVREPGSARSAAGAPRGGRRGDSPAIYLLVAAFAIAMALVGAGLWYVMMLGVESGVSSASTASRNGAVDATAPEPPPAPEEAWSALPLLEAQPLAADAWRRLDEPYAFSERPNEAWLSDEARVFTESAQEHFVAAVNAGGSAIITDAEAHLVLVNASGNAVARTKAPVMLFGRDREQRLRVPMPYGLDSGPLMVDAWVDVQGTLPTGAYLSHTLVEPIPDASGQTLRVSASNETDRPMDRLVFQLTAADDRGRPLARYRVDHTHRLAPGATVDFRVALPPPTPDNVAEWSVEAAGE